MKILLRRLGLAVALTAFVAAPHAFATPTISFTGGAFPATGSTVNLASTPAGINISVTAAPTAGSSIVNVSVSINGTAIGIATGSSPFVVNWVPTTTGNFTIAATVTDTSTPTTGASASTNTATINSVVTVNAARASTLVAPAANSTLARGSQLFLRANASMTDGIVSKVDFILDPGTGTETNIGSDSNSPYSIAYTVPAGLATGSHTILARVTAADGTTSFDSSTVTFIVSDRVGTAPTVSISAPSNNSFVATGSAVTVTATASDTDGFIPTSTGGGVTFFADGEPIGTDLTAPYSVSWTPTIAKAYSLRAVAVDDKNNSTLSDSVTVTALASLPTITLSAATTGIVGNAATLSATATASPGATITQVEFFENGTSLGTDTTAPYTLSWTPGTVGTSALTARVTDSAAAVVTSAAVNVAVSAAPPTISFSAPSSVNVNTVTTLSATATAGTGATVTQVQFLSGTTVLATDTTAPYSFDWTPTSTGTVSLTARVTDSNGTTVTSTASSVNVATAVPSVSITAPTNGTAIALGTSATLTATASGTGGATINRVDFRAGTTVVGTALAAPFSISWTPSASGIFALTARATDSNGATSTSSIVNVNVTAPSVSITSPSPTSSLTVGTATTVTANASAVGTATVASVEFFAGSTSLGIDNTAPFSVSYTPSGAGTVALSARVIDSNGAAVTSSAVSITVTAAAGPSVSLTAPANGAVVTVGSGVTVTANATAGAAALSQVQFFAGTTLIGSSSTAPYSITWTPSVAGTFSLTARAFDSAGGSTTSTAVSVTAVTATSVAFTAPAANSSAALGTAITVSASATPLAGATIASVAFSSTVGGVTTAIGTVTAAPYSVQWTPATVGATTLTATVTDSLGNTATSTVSVIVGNSGPTVTLTAPTPGQVVTAGLATTLSATAAAGSGATVAQVQFRANNIAVATVTTGAGGVFTGTWTPAAAGNFSLTAVVTDTNGGTSTSAVATVTAITTPPPTVSLTAPSPGRIVSVSSPISLTATATAATGATITAVEFLNGNAVVATSTTGPTYSATWTPTNAGIAQISARAIDSNFQTTTSSPAVAVTVVQAPTTSISTTTTGTIAVGTNVALAATATVGTGLTVQKVDFLVNGNVVGTSTTSPYTFTWVPGATGTYAVTSRVTDSAGAVVSSNNTLTLTVFSTTNPTNLTLALSPTGVQTMPAGTVRIFTATPNTTTGIDRVEFYLDSTLIATDTTSPFTTVLVAPGRAGAYELLAKVFDLSGNSVFSQTVPISVTAAVGNAPVIGVLTPNSGSFVGAGVATTITGTATDVDGSISSIQVFVNGQSIGNATLAGSLWSISWTPTATGAASIVAVAIDNVGNGGASPAVGVNVTDGSAPSISLALSPGPGQPAVATLPSRAVRNIVATVNPSTGRAVARVEFFLDGTKVGEDTQVPYTYRFVAPELAAGEQSRQFAITARATDNAGSARDAIQSVLVVQPIGLAPSVNLLTPATGASVFPNTAVSLAATATSAGGTISSVQFYVNGSPSGGSITSTPYTTTFTPTAPGSYTIDAITTDDRGNTAVSNSATITAAFATPTVTITSPNPNATARATPGVPLNLAATAVVQAGGGASILLVEFLLDGQQIGADTTAPYTFSWTPTTAQIGQHILTARVTDTNAQTALSAPVNLNVATLVGNAPTISIVQPTGGGGVGQAGNLQSLSTVNFVANASSPSTGVTVNSVEFFLNDVSIGAAAREQATNLWRLAYDLSRFDFSAAPSAVDPNTGGTRFTPVPLYAIARDSNNNQTVSSTLNLTVNPSTSSPPTVQIQNVSGTTTITQGQQFLVGVISGDTDGTVSQIQLFANGALVSAAGNPQPGSLLVYNANTAGRFNLYAVAIDDTGNTSVASPAIVLNVTAVSAPVTNLTRPGDDNTATSVGALVFLEGTAINNDSTQVPFVQFIATAANGSRTTINGTRIGTTTTYRAIWTPTTPGTFTISTQATVGTTQGTSTNSRRVVVSNITGLAPTVSINVPGSATTASNANFTATATDSDGSVVEVEFFLNRNSIGFAKRDDLANTWRLTADFAGLQLGNNEVVALARDSSGNVASSSTSFINVSAASSIAPSVTIEPSTLNAAFNRQVQLRANARDTDGSVSSVQYFANGGSIGTSTNSGTRFQVNWTPTASGTFNVWALATDNTGITRVADTVRITVRRNNPILEDAAFIVQSYLDIANTASANINPLVFDDLDARLAAGTLTRAALVDSLTIEPGFTAPINLVAAYYVLMGHWPTPANYNALIGTARGSLANAVIAILNSNEYFAKYGVVPTVALLNSPTSAIPADTFINRLWQAAGLGTPSALANLQFRSNNTLTATLGRGYGPVGLQQAIAEFITNTNSQNTALFERARTAALFYQLARPQVSVTVEQITERVNALLQLPDTKARADSLLRDTLYRYRYVTISKHPASLTLTARSGAIFSVEADGAPPLTYQWLLNGAPIAGATSSILSLTNVDTSRVGTYTAVVSSSANTATSDPATLTLTTAPTRLANISTRGVTTGGSNVMIGGFVVTGANANQTRQMLIRVVGPRLGTAPFNVGGFMADPRLEIYLRGINQPVLTNDNWGTQAGGAAQVTAIQQAAARVGAFPLNANSNDAAILATLPPGLYTVMALPPVNNPNASGVVLIEAYDVTPGAAAGPKASNVSTRGLVGTGNNIMIAGFVVSGTATRRMLIRGAGPTLGNLGVPDVVADPLLTLVNQDTGQTIRTNDNWASGEDAAIIASAASAAGAFPFANGSRDAAMIVMLDPGAYTVQLSGVGNTTGVGIVEVYDVDP